MFIKAKNVELPNDPNCDAVSRRDGNPERLELGALPGNSQAQLLPPPREQQVSDSFI
jgi:hypothetical protein